MSLGKSKCEGFELRGENELKRQVGAEPNSMLDMGPQFLVRPVRHPSNQSFPVESEFYTGVNLRPVVKRNHLVGDAAIPDATTCAWAEAILTDGNGLGVANMKTAASGEFPEV